MQPISKRLILVGVSEYEDQRFNPLPTIKGNLTSLRAHFRGWDIVNLSQRRTANRIIEGIESASKDVTDTLVFYFAGHGKLNPSSDASSADQLVMCVRKTRYDEDNGRYVDGLSIADLGPIARARTANKLLIFDCCHAEGAFEFNRIRQHYRTKGVAVLVSCGQNELGYAPENSKHTFYTGLLLDTLQSVVGADTVDAAEVSQIIAKRSDGIRANDLAVPHNGADLSDDPLLLPATPFSFNQIIRWSLGVEQANLPRLIRQDTTGMPGLLCAKVWVVELRRMIEDVLDELRRLQDQLVPLGPNDSFESFPEHAMYTVAAWRTVAVRREALESWPEFCGIAESFHNAIDHFMESFADIRDGRANEEDESDGEKYRQARIRESEQWMRNGGSQETSDSVATVALTDGGGNDASGSGGNTSRIRELRNLVTGCRDSLRACKREADGLYRKLCKHLDGG